MDFVHAYIITVLVETLILYLLLRKRYPAPAIIRNSVVANSLTLPFVWFVFPVLGSGLSWALLTAVAELFAFGAEAALYRALFGKMGWADAARVSFVCNLLSLVVGLIL
ncbi:MAG: hypothetical protein NTY83_00865 [Candidatus Micrarchaeota archaeon]|nr:hypothetical protein [Candidatus Micrarchaeota archaeon]